MTTPNLKEIFFKHDFTDDTIPELTKAREECDKVINKVEEDHNLTYDECDDIDTAIGTSETMAQYLGFIQGFKWAVSLFTGNTESEVTAE